VVANNRRFGEDSVEKMVDWTLEHVPASSDPRILEIGSGNGTLLFALREAGYAAPHLTGIDYSPDAVKLARMVARSRNSECVAFHVCDFLSDLPAPPSGRLDPLERVGPSARQGHLRRDRPRREGRVREMSGSGVSSAGFEIAEGKRNFLITCKSDHDMIDA
jgi:SAM-dependent methyltransferase